MYQTACIAAHVASGECKSEDDCDAGCRFFNAVQASCCPHVKKEGTMRLAAQQEQKRIPDGIQLCETESNQAFFDNICGEGSVRAIARDCCGAIGSNVETRERSNPHPHPHPSPFTPPAPAPYAGGQMRGTEDQVHRRADLHAGAGLVLSQALLAAAAER